MTIMNWSGKSTIDPPMLVIENEVHERVIDSKLSVKEKSPKSNAVEGQEVGEQENVKVVPKPLPLFPKSPTKRRKMENSSNFFQC